MDQTKQEFAYEVDGQLMTEQQVADMKREKLKQIYTSFVGMRDRWVTHRAQSGVEKRWRKAMDLYSSDQDGAATNEMENTLRNGPPARKPTDGTRSRVVINIVRPKVDQAVARLCEILLPVDDRNWGIKPTPKPELAQRIGNKAPTIDPATGQPTGLTADQEAQAVLEAAKEAAENMQRSIDDDLTECNYNGESRRMISDGVLLGAGILKGPFPTRKNHRVWNQGADGTQQLIMETTTTNASMRVDPWNIFFDPGCGDDHQRGRGVWERRQVSRKDLRALVGIPGYDTEAIRTVLRENPQRLRVAEGRLTRQYQQDESYELWEYHGEVDPLDLQDISCSCEGDPIEDADFAVIVMVNDTIIGAMESWVVDRTLPYDVWCWRKSEDTPNGHGLPDELDHQQRVVNAAWRQVMDNARFSMGGQIVAKKGKILPANNSYEITPGKLWYAKDDIDNVSDAFAVFEFNSHLQELLMVAQAAMQFADTETSMPQILGGQQGSAPETVGGMVMLYNNANAVLRQRVKLYDDAVTRPHIGRYYDFKMANDPDPSIKGDFDIAARGSTALVERDIQNQAMINLANITNNPRYVPHLKEREELKAILKAFKINPDELMKTQEQVDQDAEQQAQQGAPQDPRIEAANLALKAKQMDIADRQQARQVEAQLTQEEHQVRTQEIQANLQRAEIQARSDQYDADMKRAITIAKMEQDGQMTQQELEAKRQLEMVKIADKREQFNAEMAVKVNQGSGI